MVRWIRVDDFDERIIYSGSNDTVHSWSPVQFAGSSPKDMWYNAIKDSFLGTAHMPNIEVGAVASLSFTFNGTGVAIYGMYGGLARADCTPCSNSPHPSWQCLIDGVPITNNQPYSQLQWESYCETDNLADGVHTLKVLVPRSNTYLRSAFWVDFVQYIPSPSSTPSLEPSYLIIDSTDPAIVYKGQWEPLGTSNMTTNSGELFVEFTGTSITWYGLSPYVINATNPSLFQKYTNPYGITGCTYSIDGKPPIYFTANVEPDYINATTFNYNQIILQTAALADGPHNLSVSGFDPTIPFTLDYLVVGTSTSQLPTSGLPRIDSVPTSNKSGVNLVAILGGTLGGSLAALLLLASCLYYGKRRKTPETELASIFTDNASESMNFVEPFRSSFEHISDVKSSDATSSGPSTNPAFSSNNGSSTQVHSGAPLMLSTAPSILLHSATKPTFTFALLDRIESPTYTPTQPSSQPPTPARSTHQANLDIFTNPSRLSTGLQSTATKEDDTQQLSETTIAITPPLSGRRRSHIVRHADSGIRLSSIGRTDAAVELPPRYTAE